VIAVQSNWDGHEFDPAGVSLTPGKDEGCQYCGDPVKAPTTVVFGQPMADVVTVVDAAGVRVCGDCVKPALWLAMAERDPRRPGIRVVPLRSVLSPVERAELDREVRDDRTRDAAGMD